MEATAAIMVSPSSDERFWNKLRDRVDVILEQRKPSSSMSGVESEIGKRFREDSMLLIRGLDSAVASLSQLAHSLNSAQQGLNDLAKPSLSNLQHRESHETTYEEEVEPNAKRQCHPTKILKKYEETDSKDDVNPDRPEEVKHVSMDVAKSANLKKAKNLAISMASKAASLARELKTVKSELCLMQGRCTLLEEENRRLRDGVEKGVRSEDDDLVRLQMEALLAEKSRLANENANLTRENQCLQQLVEYHQLATQDDDDASSPPSSSYEQAIHGVCLDFSSPLEKGGDSDFEDYEKGCNATESTSAPYAYKEENTKEQ